jgi:hypothetical protein
MILAHCIAEQQPLPFLDTNTNWQCRGVVHLQHTETKNKKPIRCIPTYRYCISLLLEGCFTVHANNRDVYIHVYIHYRVEFHPSGAID